MNLKKNNKKIPVIINCDTGIDDAVALMIAVKSEKLDIKLITTDVGNVEPKQAALNTLNILELIGASDIPVVAGDGKCFERDRKTVSRHGNGGLGEYVFESNSRRLTPGDAVEKLYETLSASEEKITLISLSPLSNIARLITKHPDCISKIERLVFMAGSIEEVKDNEMPYSEFNIASDPEAAEVVVKSGISLQVVPMEMGHLAYLDWEEVFKTKIENFTGSVFEVIFRSYRDRHVKNGIATHDGTAVAFVTNPELFETKPIFAEIVYFDSIDSGVIVMDFKKKSNALSCVKVDIKKFKKLYFNCLKKCK